MLGRAEPHFSFAGLKTALRQRAGELSPMSEQDVADLCASFELAVTDSVTDRCRRAIAIADARLPDGASRRLVMAGGVAANRGLRSALVRLANERGYSFHVPPQVLCTDNGAMIAWAGAERLARGWIDSFDVRAHARWVLDARAEPVLGAGRLGAKA
jgi:N6-L-threonylcarbamoyladenine synthase